MMNLYSLDELRFWIVNQRRAAENVKATASTMGTTPYLSVEQADRIIVATQEMESVADDVDGGKVRLPDAVTIVTTMLRKAREGR